MCDEKLKILKETLAEIESKARQNLPFDVEINDYDKDEKYADLYNNSQSSEQSGVISLLGLQAQNAALDDGEHDEGPFLKAPSAELEDD